MKSLFFILFILLVPYNNWSQRVVLMLEVEPAVTEPGEDIVVKVTSNIQGKIEIKFPESFKSGYNVMNGQKSYKDYTTNQFINTYYLSQNGSFSKAGNYTIGPALITIGNKVYKSNTVTVTVRELPNPPKTNNEAISKNQIGQSAFGVIIKSKSSVFEGEPLIMESKVYCMFSPSFLENYQPSIVEGINEKQQLPSSSRINMREEKVGQFLYNSFEYDKKIVFLSGSGKKKISPFELSLRNGFEIENILSEPSTVEVKPLPKGAPNSFTGGVGEFSIKREAIKTNLKQGDVFKLVLEINGTGNLQQLAKPNLNLPKDFALYGDPIIKENITYTTQGAEGNITYTFNIQVLNHGQIKLPATSFSYFDPLKAKYIELSTGEDLLTVTQNPNFNVSTNNLNGKYQTYKAGDDPSKTLDSSTNAEGFYTSPLLWTTIGIPILLALSILLFKKLKTSSPQRFIPEEIPAETIRFDNHLTIAETCYQTQNLQGFYSALEKETAQILRSHFKDKTSENLPITILLENAKNEDKSYNSTKRNKNVPNKSRTLKNRHK